MSGLQDVAHSWMAEPPWQKIFKHTFDVIVDYICYVLIAIDAIALSVRFLTVLGSGDLFCVIIGVEDGTPGQTNPYIAGSVVGLVNYASANPKCIQSVMTQFMIYLPYIIMVQTITLVIVEKFSFKIPRIAQKVERFYKNIVEDSLFGKDPDVTEDMTDPKTSTEAISRHRQRNEICMSLKRTKIITYVYVIKNSFEVVLISVYLCINILYLIYEDDTGPASCKIKLASFPGTVEKEGIVHFQCQGKKMDYFVISLLVHTVFLALHGICSIGAVIWCLLFRSVSNLLRKIQSSSLNYESDFFFLFDLLAHNCGLESTLRVLTHSDNLFYDICKPHITISEDLVLEEDKLKITWKPAIIEQWLSKQNFRTPITIESYEVTIFPAETIHNSTTIPATLKYYQNDPNYSYQTWFYDLQGGRIEYVITIACMIGKSRMKGEKVVTNLVPYGPELPQAGLVKSVQINQAEIFWDPPKGEFTKYILTIEQILDEAKISNNDDENDLFKQQLSIKPPRQIENLSYKLTTYTIIGLEPGEKYKAELNTKTGNVLSRQYISDIIVTKPKIPEGPLISDITPTSCILQWLLCSGQSCLRGFQISVTQSLDSKVIKNIAVKKVEKKFKLIGLNSGTNYVIHLSALCSYENIKTESDKSELTLVTPPEPPRSLTMKSSGTNNIWISWEPAATTYKTLSYSVAIDHNKLDYHFAKEIPSTKYNYMFNKLPDIVGTGEIYQVSVSCIIYNTTNNEGISSEALTESFYTKPLSPTNFQIEDNNQYSFTHSATEAVKRYRLQWGISNKDDEDSSIEETLLTVIDRTEPMFFQLPHLIRDTVYNINIYAALDILDQVVESSELHVSIFWSSGESQPSIYNERSTS